METIYSIIEEARNMHPIAIVREFKLFVDISTLNTNKIRESIKDTPQANLAFLYS